MTKYARIVNGKVHETFTPPVGVPISDCFVPELVAQFIECGDTVEQNWTYQDGVFTEPVFELASEIIDVEEVTPTPALEG